MRFLCGERIYLERKMKESVRSNSYNNHFIIIIILSFFLIKFNQHQNFTNPRVTTNRVLETRLVDPSNSWRTFPAKTQTQSNSIPILQFTSPKEARGSRDNPACQLLTPTSLLLLSPPCFFPQRRTIVASPLFNRHPPTKIGRRKWLWGQRK